MAHSITPSVGRVVKKMIEINPELGIRELSEIIRESIFTQEPPSLDFAPAEIIDEAKALRLAQASCYQGKSG